MHRVVIVLFAFLFVFASLAFGQDELQNFPISYARTNNANDLDRGPLIYDLDGDGNKEIIVVTTQTVDGVTSRTRLAVYSLTDLGNPVYLDLPENLREQGYVFRQTPSIADVNGDGYPEIVACAYWKHIYTGAWGDDCPATSCHHDDSPDWGRSCVHYRTEVCVWDLAQNPPPLAHFALEVGATVAVVGDIDGDHRDDIVVAGPNYHGFRWSTDYHRDKWTWGNSVIACKWNQDIGRFDAQTLDLEPRPSFCLVDNNIEPDGYDIKETYPALADIDGDGVKDVLAIFPEEVSLDARLYWYNDVTNTCNSALIQGHGLVEGDGLDIQPGPIVCDIDGNGNLDAVFAVGQQFEQQAIAVVNLSTANVQTVPLPNNHHVYGRSLLAAANGPSVTGLDVYIPALNNQDLSTKFLRMNSAMQFPNNQFNWPKSLAASDANINDGYAPCIARTDEQECLEFVTQTGNSAGTNSIRNFRLDDQHGSDYLWSVPNYSGSQSLLSAPTVCDLDQDGLADLVVVTGTSATDASIHAYKLRSDANRIPYNPETVEWNGFQNGPAHTGLYAQPVSGNQPLDTMTWSGRITVYGQYVVPTNKQLTILPGTVVEFQPTAEQPEPSIIVDGALFALGIEKDSIYFKPNGTSPWGTIMAAAHASVYLDYCVIHGGGVLCTALSSVGVSNSRIYDTPIGIESNYSNLLTVGYTTIHNCSYGIRGTTSAGDFQDNKIFSCTNAGVYWIGDYTETHVAPYFARNVIQNNGGPAPSGFSGGCYFNNTTARLECNQIIDNYPNQVYCENSANIIMNANGQRAGGNYLSVESKDKPPTLHRTRSSINHPY